MSNASEFIEVKCPNCHSKRAIFPEDAEPFKCYSCGGLLPVHADRGVATVEKAKTPDDTLEVHRQEKVMTTVDGLQVYRERDLNSTVIAHIPKGVELQLGTATVFEECEWIEVTFQDSVGYVFGFHARTHTTFEYDVVPATVGKLWACPTCNTIVTDPLRDSSKHFYCRAGHRAYRTQGPSADFSRYISDFIALLLIGGAGYLATYYVPQVCNNLLDNYLFANRVS